MTGEKKLLLVEQMYQRLVQDMYSDGQALGWQGVTVAQLLLMAVGRGVWIITPSAAMRADLIEKTLRLLAVYADDPGLLTGEAAKTVLAAVLQAFETVIKQG